MLDSITTYINDHYGSRRGLLRYCVFGIQNFAGRFRRLKQLERGRVERLVFVCQGNICRSPVAAAYAVQRANFPAVSFGLNCRDGAPADPRAISFANDLGLDLNTHRSSHIQHYQPQASDLVIAMEPIHLELIDRSLLGAAQLTLLGLWLPLSTPYIHDPYTSDAAHFSRCEESVVDAVGQVVNYLCR